MLMLYDLGLALGKINFPKQILYNYIRWFFLAPICLIYY